MKKSKKIGQTIYLKECLRDSYFSLLEEKTAESISVSEIVKLAGVSRMSFYRYYQTKEDIIQQYINDSFNEFMVTVRNDLIKDPKVAAALFFNYFRSNKTRIKILINQGLFHLFFESFSNFLQESNLAIDSTPDISDESLNYYYEYASGGILNLAKSWVRSDMKESDEEMAQILRQIKQAQGAKYQ